MVARGNPLYASAIARNRAFVFQIIAPMLRQWGEFIVLLRRPMRQSPSQQSRAAFEFDHEIVMRPLDPGVMQNDVTQNSHVTHANNTGGGT